MGPMFLQADSEDSDQTDQADLSLCWVHRSFCWFCHVAAHMLSLILYLGTGVLHGN